MIDLTLVRQFLMASQPKGQRGILLTDGAAGLALALIAEIDLSRIDLKKMGDAVDRVLGTDS